MFTFKRLVVAFGARLVLASVFTAFLAFTVQAQQVLQNVPAELVQYPDTILFNGKIHTMDDATLTKAQGKVVEAIAITGDRIKALGTNVEVSRLAGPQTRKFDLKGRTVVPGIINTHTHIHDHALRNFIQNNPKIVDGVIRRIRISGKTFEEFTAGIELALKENVGKTKPRQWLWIDISEGGVTRTDTTMYSPEPKIVDEPIGGLGSRYMEANVMTRERLDQLAPNVPVNLSAGGAIVATGGTLLNTAAIKDWLSLWGASYEEFETLSEANQKTALNGDRARYLLVDRYFPSHIDELADLYEEMMLIQAAGGITTFASHMEPAKGAQRAYLHLIRNGRMPIRMAWADSACAAGEPFPERCVSHKGDLRGVGFDNFWNIGLTLKGIDGHNPSICSTMEGPREVLEREECNLGPGSPDRAAARAAILQGLRYRPEHAFGDRGMDHVLEMIEELIADKNHPEITVEYIRSLRITPDHCAFQPRLDQIPRMAKLGFISSCGGREVRRSASWLGIYGEQYANRIAPIRSMLDGGLMTTVEGEIRYDVERTHDGGTIVKGESPFSQYMRFVSRRDDWGRSIAPEQAVDRVELLKMATVWASHYVLKEKVLGTLEAGKFADLIVLNKDYFTVPETELTGVFPLMTIAGGKPIVVREEYSAEIGLPTMGPQVEFIITDF